ncbi:PLP-dependent aminotransferase family protein [Chitinivorax sp. B]|uniref:MocR-like pyridoxine biosynthesis transcription factor PdxR n=1 Tax=Chitinivorax sp. B TaxID=2502235 RepID=UPI0010F67862|nr:PLP-dependent aminotransferase family protein [Chitinivorax sp. B]
MLRPWSLSMPLQRTSDLALHLQIAQAVVDDIRRGRLMPGDALPGTRALADELIVNRKTVVQAFDELQAQGWIELQPRRGAFVSAQLPVQGPTQVTDVRSTGLTLPPVSPPLARYMDQSLLRVNRPDEVLAFSDGVPDSRLIPYNVLSHAYRHALLVSVRHNQLGYGDPTGTPSLRHAIADMLRMERGLNVQASQVCVVRGSQMGIYLAARLLGGPQTHAVFESLSYPPAREAFRASGATVHSVAQDAYGLIPEALEQLCQRFPVRAVFVTPHHQFPTTVMLPADRRLRLLALAEQYDFAVVEDDYDHEFHYLRSPVPPLASMDRYGRVLHIGSLSKVLAPGLRLGYVVAAERVVDRCAADIMLIDRQGNQLTELAVSELMARGELRRHIRRALKIYQSRRDHLASVLRSELGGQVHFDLPAGGIALWLRLDERVNMVKLAQDCLAEHVAILPGQAFSQDDQPVRAFRLGFGNLNEAELDVGVTRLKRALARQGRA